MQRTFEKVTVNFLKEKVDKAVKRHNADYDSLEEAILELTTRVKDDLSKVTFDSENVECRKTYVEARDYDFLGYQTLDNLSYLGCYAGGDWEWPVYFIIYWDGKKLRAYIPEKGNLWNTDTKEAYGNNDKKDIENVIKRFGYSKVSSHLDSYPLEYDFDRMRWEIKERIIENVK